MRLLIFGMLLLQGCVRGGFDYHQEVADKDVGVQPYDVQGVELSDHSGSGTVDSSGSVSSFWLGVNSSHLATHCGDDLPHPLAAALDGTNEWRCNSYHQHWVELDLGQSYTIYKIRSRSNEDKDPIEVDVFISETQSNWGTPVLETVSVWQDTTKWTEVSHTPKVGRYVRFEVDVTEDGSRARIEWGNVSSSFSILDIEVSLQP